MANTFELSEYPFLYNNPGLDILQSLIDSPTPDLWPDVRWDLRVTPKLSEESFNVCSKG